MFTILQLLGLARGAPTGLVAVSQLIGSLLFLPIIVSDFFSDLSLNISISIHCSLFSFGHFLAILDVSLSLDRSRARTSRERTGRERGEASAEAFVKSTEASTESTTESAKASHATKAASHAKMPETVILVHKPSERIASLLLLSLFRPLLTSKTAKATSKEVIIIVKEACKWIFASKELLEDIFCSCESEV